MKRFLRTTVTMMLMVALAARLVLPVEASSLKRKGKLWVSIPARKWESEYPAYARQEDGDAHEVEIFLNEDEFPVFVSITNAGGVRKDLEIEGYGRRYLAVGSLLNAPSFATLRLSPPKAKVKEEVPKKVQPTTKESLETNQGETKEKKARPADKLIELLDFPFSMNDYNRSKLKIDAFYTGDWDGDELTKYCRDIWPLSFSENVTRRIYRFSGVNLRTGTMYELEQSVDYLGCLEQVAGDDFTLAYSLKNRRVEMWREFKLLESWDLPETGVVETVLPLMSADDCYGLVTITDADGEKHMYDLCSDGVVKKLF